MLTIFRKDSELSNYCYLYNDVLVDPIVIFRKELRTEEKYDSDVGTEITAQKLIHGIINKFSKKAYLILAGQDVLPSNDLRMKKFVMLVEKKFPKLDRRVSEVYLYDNLTRYVSIINLDCYDFSLREGYLLNWLHSFILLTDLDIDEVLHGSRSWLQKKSKSALAFNYSAIMENLKKHSESTILRYFPADNGKRESIIAIGDEGLVANKLKNYLESLNAEMD